jgi:ketosteroid isomerase-like protein
MERCTVPLTSATRLTKEVLMLSQADANAVKAQIDMYVQATLAADWDAWSMTLAADVFVSPSNQVPMASRETAVAWARNLPTISRFIVDVQEIIGDGDIACARGMYELDLTLADGLPARERGAFLEVHRRNTDGTWPYTHAMWHSIEPAPAPTTSGG